MERPENETSIKAMKNSYDFSGDTCVHALCTFRVTWIIINCIKMLINRIQRNNFKFD